MHLHLKSKLGVYSSQFKHQLRDIIAGVFINGVPGTNGAAFVPRLPPRPIAAVPAEEGTNGLASTRLRLVGPPGTNGCASTLNGAAPWPAVSPPLACMLHR